MKAMGMMSEHINYLQRYEMIFIGACVSGVVTVSFIVHYVNTYVDGDIIAKFAVYLTFIFIVGFQLFINVVVITFYLTIQIKFSLLNEFFV